ncbi:MAG: hypothetical protein ACOCWQ_01965 [Nanoarchaeota archaeon]
MKAQQALEFITLTGIVVLLTISLIFIMQRQLDHTQEKGVSDIMAGVADDVEFQIEQMLLSPSDIRRQIEVPPFDGKMWVEDGRMLILNGTEGEYYEFFDYYLHGDVCKGTNMLWRYGPFLGSCCDCEQMNITFANETLCMERPFVWQDCSRFTINDSLRGLVTNCTNTTDMVRFEWQNSTDVVFAVNSTDHMDAWFYASVNHVLADPVFTLTWSCYEGGVSVKSGLI